MSPLHIVGYYHALYILVGLGAHGGPRVDKQDTELLVKVKNFSTGNGRVIAAISKLHYDGHTYDYT